MSNVTFGGGLLCRLQKGGTFYAQQKEVAPGDWELSLLDVHITGKALLFKTISEQQHQENTDFRSVPANVSLAQAAALVQEGTSTSASIGTITPLQSVQPVRGYVEAIRGRSPILRWRLQEQTAGNRRL